MEKVEWKVLLWISFLFFSPCQGEKILFFFAGGSYSHKHSVWPWAVELANRGHEVTFLSGHEKKPSDDSKVHDVSSNTLKNLMAQSYGNDRFTERQQEKEKEFLRFYIDYSLEICETLFNARDDPALKPFLESKVEFDLVIVNIIYGECGFLFASQYQAKTITYDASVTLPWIFDTYGLIPDTAWLPDVLYKTHSIPINFMERFTNTLRPLYWYWRRYFYLYPAMEKLMAKGFNLEKVPSYLELERNTSLVFINNHPAIDFAISMPPVIIQMGGIQAWMPEKPIPQIYQDFMDASGPSGVVLISFGSTINLEKIPNNYIHIFFNLIKKYKDVRFLLKWKGPLPKGFEHGLDNLLQSDWLPQKELLRHPKLKAFVTHGGLNSIQEATYYGVPMIVLPLFADQDYNAYRIEAQKVGFRLEIRDLTFEVMDEALHRVLTDPQYKTNMVTKSEIFRDRPQSPLDTVVYWTEFVLRHDDTSTLKPMSNHLTWYQRRVLDVYAVYFTIIILTTLALILLVYKTISCIFRSSKSDQKKIKSS